MKKYPTKLSQRDENLNIEVEKYQIMKKMEINHFIESLEKQLDKAEGIKYTACLASIHTANQLKTLILK